MKDDKEESKIEEVEDDEDKKDKDLKKEEKLMLNGTNEKSDAGSKEGKANEKDKKKG